ncbi:hypothetical protein SAMN06296010_3297 [Agreia pratensis]|uniref:DUF3137 domain-containing protein n=1 Tax=Agreia pratensis TaxID=150121 RepID=A0A1X7L3T1_9MICO|nr:hypothetical protein SAMN06296010_3297 [Agreia pratensis]
MSGSFAFGSHDNRRASKATTSVVWVTLDTTPLTEPIDRRALREFRRTLPSTVRPKLATVLLPIALLAVPFVFMIMFLTAVGFDQFIVRDKGPSSLVAFVPVIAMPVVAITLLVRALRQRNGVRQFRIAEFARANSFSYSPRTERPWFPGMIFEREGQSSSYSTDIVSREGGAPTTIANHTSIVGSGKNRSVYRWGYVALRLATPLPNIVLDAQKNNSWGRAALPVALAARQRLSLEGDFDQHFALYCPAGYEADALYLFTPDIMARFIDNAASFDIEIIDDYLFLYAQGELSTLDPELWKQLLATVEVLSQRVRQWARWRDERLDAGGAAWAEGAAIPNYDRRAGVAPQGRRLARRADWWWIVGALLAIFGFYNIFKDLL